MKSVHDRATAARGELTRREMQIAVTEEALGFVGIAAYVIKAYASGKVAVLGFADKKINPPFVTPDPTLQEQARVAHDEYNRFQYDDGLGQDK